MGEMTDSRHVYRSPLEGRYASREMLELFSERKKILTWRKLWIHLAEVEQELGLDISTQQIREMQKAQKEIDFELAESFEKETRHDVMAHIKAFATLCPKAGGIIHLGATSCFVTDNTELVLIKEACQVIIKRLLHVMEGLAQFAKKHEKSPTLAYTHFQPAQLTTVGKRACLWLQDLLMDFQDLNLFIETLSFRGVKGTTGTQASFLKLFNGDHDKVKALDEKVSQRMGFSRSFPITGQTYPRKIDAKLLSVLAGIAVSSSKFASDIRLLAHENELEEPFLKTQIGSSAMAYKRNPMRCERISSLSRFAISLLNNPFHVAANQWLERTLDDSASRRIFIPESFLTIDAVLRLYSSVAQGLVVNPNRVKNNLQEEIGFMATENILMEAVRAGGNRQELHEKIRAHAMKAIQKRKETGEPSDLIERLRSDSAFAAVTDEIDRLLEPELFIGRSAEQVNAFLNDVVSPLLDKHRDLVDAAQEEVKF